MNSSELGGGREAGTEFEERQMPLKMKPGVPERIPTWYMQMYHTQHIEHVKLEEDSDLTDLSKRKQNKKKKKRKEKKMSVIGFEPPPIGLCKKINSHVTSYLS